MISNQIIFSKILSTLKLIDYNNTPDPSRKIAKISSLHKDIKL